MNEKTVSGRSRPVPVRFSAISDAIIKDIQAKRGFESYNFTVNWIIEQFNRVEEWRRERIAAHRRALESDGLRLKDLE